MDRNAQSERKRPVGKTVVYGLLTCGCYAALFLNADSVMQYFTRGAWYAALPITTVLVFSVVHGAFASNLWTSLGIDAARKGARPRPEARKRLPARPRPRVRPRLSV